MDPILLFLVVGTFAMSASICASQLLKLPEPDQPGWMAGKSGKMTVLLGGNLSALVLVATVVYGIYHLTWWIPLACLFVTFPVMHVVILEKLLGSAKGFWVSGVLSLAGAVALWMFW